ncbi:nucleoside monophosphate kinase [Patescibacteria group bacterium]|nr:nucleoside monophosphate kinase [Patescibacteria group bacterium]
MKGKILLIGPQGSGKSSQGKLLSEFLKVPLISTGDILRDLAKQDTEQGKVIRMIMGEGRLVDDQTISQIVKDRLTKSDCQSRFIMDGYPRTLKQLEYFDPKFDAVFYLELSDEEATDRLMRRGRGDDTQEAIAQRLKLYHYETDPIIAYYQQKSLLKGIDGCGTIEQVQQRIREVLNGGNQK